MRNVFVRGFSRDGLEDFDGKEEGGGGFGGAQKTYIWIKVKAFVLEYGECELQDLPEDKEIFEVMCHFFGNELHEIGHELVKTRITLYACKSCDLIIRVRFIENRAADLLKIELDFFGQDVLDLGFYSDVIGATYSCEVRYAGSFGYELLIPGIGSCRILRY